MVYAARRILFWVYYGPLYYFGYMYLLERGVAVSGEDCSRQADCMEG